MFDVTRLTDRAAVRAYLARDRRLTAYALGDLDDAFWPHSAFYGAWRDGELAALALLYSGLDPTILTAFGAADGVRAVFEAVDLPEEIYYLFSPDMEALLDAWYERPGAHRETRMVLDPAHFAPPPAGQARPIAPGQADELAALYCHAAEPGEAVVAFSPWQIAHGAFYGVWEGDVLVATAGTHVWSRAESVATIGNVFTHPDHRGRGYASACTAAVADEALRAGIGTVALNVRQDNAPAIHVYEKLGFRPYCTFLEGPGLLRAQRKR